MSGPLTGMQRDLLRQRVVNELQYIVEEHLWVPQTDGGGYDAVVRRGPDKASMQVHLRPTNDAAPVQYILSLKEVTA